MLGTCTSTSIIPKELERSPANSTVDLITLPEYEKCLTHSSSPSVPFKPEMCVLQVLKSSRPLAKTEEEKRPTSLNKLKPGQSARATTIARVLKGGNNVLHVRDNTAVRADHQQPQYQASELFSFFCMRHDNRYQTTENEGGATYQFETSSVGVLTGRSLVEKGLELSLSFDLANRRHLSRLTEESASLN